MKRMVTDLKKRFSKNFSTYREWRDHSEETKYSRKIQRLHNLYPTASLSQLRGHARRGERRVGQLKKAPPSKIKWSLLKPKEASTRQRSLEAVNLMRTRGYSLTKASKVAGTTPETVKRHTGAIKKVGNRYTPKKYDTVSREMRINTNGREIWVSVKDSRHASTIGKYHNAVKQYLNTGDLRYLKPFKNKRIRDSEGRYHTLETDPHTLHEIQERRPNEEFFMIYRAQED